MTVREYELLEYLGIQISDYESVEKQDRRRFVVNSFNDKLKQIVSFEMLQVFLNHAEQGEMFLLGRRNGSRVYAFTHMYEPGRNAANPYAGIEDYRNKVHYLYEDGRTGSSYVRNLYRTIKVVSLNSYE